MSDPSTPAAHDVGAPRRAARRWRSRALIWTLIGVAIALGLYFYFAYAPDDVAVRATT